MTVQDADLDISEAGRLRTAGRFDDQVMAKVSARLLWFLFVLYCAAFLDRINIGFAALTMNKDLGLTAAMYGFATTVFYTGFIVAEVPSNLALARFGARRWIARIMVTWGLASAATMFATSETSLYVIRFLIGLAEGGFLPGVLLYMSYWFPPSYRVRATALFMVAQPVTTALGAPVSGLILQMDHAGLAGWQWMFLLQGLPAVVLGVVTWFYLTERPENAAWLNGAEKAAIARRFEAEEAVAGAPRSHAGLGVWRELGSRDVLLLCLGYFCLVVSLNTGSIWTPQIMREVLGGATSLFVVSAFSALPALCTIVSMLGWGWWAERSRNRNLSTVLPMVFAGTGWMLVAFAAIPALRVLGLVMGSMGSFTAMTVFWTLPMEVLSKKARPAGVALVSAFGMLGSATSPWVVGVLKDLTGTFAAGLGYATIMLGLGVVAVMVMPKVVPPQRRPRA
jgi:ACS family 4-hydroxyphenylacetate permease-like MFS transporter